MKNALYTKVICRGFCPFYREGKEDLACATYNFLAGALTPAELEVVVRQLEAVPELFGAAEIRKLICQKCDFRIDGCDFWNGVVSRPCGGHTIVSRLMRKSLVPFNLEEEQEN